MASSASKDQKTSAASAKSKDKDQKTSAAGENVPALNADEKNAVNAAFKDKQKFKTLLKPMMLEVELQNLLVQSLTDQNVDFAKMRSQANTNVDAAFNFLDQQIKDYSTILRRLVMIQRNFSYRFSRGDSQINFSMVHLILLSDNKKLIKKWIKNNSHRLFETLDDSGRTALHYLMLANHLDILRELNVDLMQARAYWIVRRDDKNLAAYNPIEFCALSGFKPSFDISKDSDWKKAFDEFVQRHNNNPNQVQIHPSQAIAQLDQYIDSLFKVEHGINQFFNARLGRLDVHSTEYFEAISDNNPAKLIVYSYTESDEQKHNVKDIYYSPVNDMLITDEQNRFGQKSNYDEVYYASPHVFTMIRLLQKSSSGFTDIRTRQWGDFSLDVANRISTPAKRIAVLLFTNTGEGTNYNLNEACQAILKIVAESKSGWLNKNPKKFDSLLQDVENIVKKPDSFASPVQLLFCIIDRLMQIDPLGLTKEELNAYYQWAPRIAQIMVSTVRNQIVERLEPVPLPVAAASATQTATTSLFGGSAASAASATAAGSQHDAKKNAGPSS